MLKDESRTKTYREAIKSHAKQFHNKVVLDVGIIIYIYIYLFIHFF